VAVVAVVLTVVLWPRDAEPSLSSHVSGLAGELRCPDCEGQSIAQSSTTTARAARADIRRRIEAGQSDAEIRQAYIDKFGDSILLKPEGEGLGIVVWALPVVVLVVGAAGLVLALRRWRTEPKLHPTDADERLVEETRGRRSER
jgi:cytochrome c-type biogenesis protein CcmH